jgi:hypothetical protein
MTRSNRRLAAFTVIAVGLAGTIVDPDGVVGVTLFGAAAAALLFLIGPPIVKLIGAAGRPNGGFSPRRVPLLVRPRTLAVATLGAGALLGATNLVDSNSDAALERILNDATFLGGLMLIAAMALVLLGSTIRWTRRAYRAAPPVAPRAEHLGPGT